MLNVNGASRMLNVLVHPMRLNEPNARCHTHPRKWHRLRKHHGTMYVGHGRSVPCTNGPIKRSSLAEHKLYAGQGRGVPCTNGLIECRSNPCTDGLVNAAASPNIRLMVVTVEVFYAPVG